MDWKGTLKTNKTIYWVAYILVLVGGINWGLVGLVGLNLVDAIFGSLLARLVFILVGVSAGYLCYLLYLDKMGGNRMGGGSRM